MSNHHPNRALSIKKLEARRKKAGRLFDKGETAYFVHKKFNISTTTAREWKERWKDGTLKAQLQGRCSKLTQKQKKHLKQKIIKGPESQGYATQLWTLERITKLIKNTEDISYRPRSVWHLIRELGFSYQKPTTRAKERNEKAIKEWKETTWPKLLKKGLS